ncbi:fatty acid cis/trans isomerase [Cobetia sp. 5-11-6-3]|uniref:fatty acid cis/trans isomerase n=1 Tax=Cobetia sp. 5-11-6-3 TaxID=2737458 RepID=UPI001596E1C6|nr:fatty acid cis/trans isomerase [Cobetia sp. 5-11-6-3]
MLNSLRRLWHTPRWRWSILVILLLGGCSAVTVHQLDARFGTPEPRDRVVSGDSLAGRHWEDEVKPILETRCVVCHGCYDAPCQLKMSSAAGIDRGINPAPVYDGTRLLAANLTRLFEDADSTAEWRDMNFSPVLNERNDSALANLEGSVLFRSLSQKRKQPLPVTEEGLLPEDRFDLSLNRSQVCAPIERYDAFAEDHPDWGMPYALPQISDEEHRTLVNWLAQGSPMTKVRPVSEALVPRIQQVEAFLNGDSLKQRLMSRYIYEHLFLTHLYFPEAKGANGRPIFFSLVRSSTPPGEPIQRISSRRPYDAPYAAYPGDGRDVMPHDEAGRPRVYYRLWQERSTILAKNHLPYSLSDARLERWQSLFLAPDYTVDDLPGYDLKTASNPFLTFEAIPAESRYRFMLDESQNTIMGFIKGPVCRGQVAVDVINDHFWVSFTDPSLFSLPQVERTLAREGENLSLPAEQSSNALPISSWIKFERKQQAYLQAKQKLMMQAYEDGNLRLDMQLLWDGSGWQGGEGGDHNPNAALTVYRHFDNAAVMKGLVGNVPKTAWVIDYPMLERIHYLLVAGFDVYGNLGHQLTTRLYMDFLRMEGENNLLALLPAGERQAVHDSWYQDVDSGLEKLLFKKPPQFDAPSDIVWTPGELSSPDKARIGLMRRLRERLAPELVHERSLETLEDDAVRRELKALSEVSGLAASLLPEVTIIALEREGSEHPQLFSVLRNSAHANITSLFDEEANRRPERDTLDVLRGVAGDYPNAFWHLTPESLQGLARRVAVLKDEADYRQLMADIGVRRTDPRFWQFSDSVLRANYADRPVEAGLLDYNRLQNR